MKPYLSILLLISFITSAQTKAFTPTKGKIVFSEQTIMEDASTYSKSVKALVSDAGKTAEREGTTVDTVQLSQIAAVIEKDHLSPKNKRHFDFKEGIIVSYQTFNGEKRGDYKLIDVKNATTSMLAKKDSTTIYLKDRPYQYSENEVVSLKEFKNETRTIQGYKCYKVVATIKEKGSSSELVNNSLTYKELWVADNIKCLYHPVIYEKTILKKYYPLEIKEYSDLLKGVVTLYVLDTITLR